MTTNRWRFKDLAWFGTALALATTLLVAAGLGEPTASTGTNGTATRAR